MDATRLMEDGIATERSSRFVSGDLWSPDEPLPGGRALNELAARILTAWEMPHLIGPVRIGYNARLRTTLGRALLDEHRVELNPHLLRDHPGELIPTLAHELAHLAVHLRYGRAAASHGLEFRTLMRALDLSGRATHDLPVGHLRQGRRRYLYVHRCDTCGVQVVARRVLRNRICARCGPAMQWNVLRVPNTPGGRAMVKELLEGTPD